MCEYSGRCEYAGRLIAWLDRELPEEEASNVEWHIAHCAECRQAAKRYEEIGAAFLDCYEMAMPGTRRRSRPWHLAPVLVGAAAALLLAILLRPQPAGQLPLDSPPAPPVPAMALVRAPAPAVIVHTKHTPAPRQVWVPEEPAVEVALPADALFPPGAVPPGFSFIAEVRPQP